MTFHPKWVPPKKDMPSQWVSADTASNDLLNLSWTLRRCTGSNFMFDVLVMFILPKASLLLMVVVGKHFAFVLIPT